MIRTKLTAWNCAVLAFVLAITGFAIYFTTKQTLYKALDEGLLQRAQFFAASWRGGPFGRPNDEGPRTNSPGEPGQSGPSGIPFSEGIGGGQGSMRFGQGPNPNEGSGPPEPHIDPVAAREQGIDPAQLKQLEALRTALRPIVLDLTGKDVVHPETKAWDMVTFAQAKAGSVAFGFANQGDIRMRVLSFPIRQNGKVTQIIQIGSPMLTEDQALTQLAKTLTIVLPLAVILMLAVGVALTRLALRPVGSIASAAEQIEITNLSDRLPVLGKDEFAQLSSTFNGLLDRLQSAFDEKDQAFGQLRRFTADASHELKTPLTAIQLRTGVALMRDLTPAKYKEHLLAIDRASGQMNAVVQDLLFLAASDEGQLNLRKDRVNLGDVIGDAISSVDTSNHTLEQAIDPTIELTIDPAAMARVLVNIIKNSVLYTEAGKTIRVESERKEGFATIRVIDQGEGIPANHVPLIFERFHRVDSSRFRDSGGSGLGLAIVKAIVELHNGKISLESELRKGTTVTISLPII